MGKITNSVNTDMMSVLQTHDYTDKICSLQYEQAMVFYMTGDYEDVLEGFKK